MASNRSEQRYVVTRTVKTTGPDGKIQTQTLKEETKVVSRDGQTTKTTVTTTDSDHPQALEHGSAPKPKGFGAIFNKSKTPKAIVEPASTDRPRSPRYDIDDPTSRLGALSLGPTSKGRDGKPKPKPKVSLDEFRKQALTKHNEYRAKHGAKPLKLSSDLNSTAQSWADNLGRTGNFAHRPNNKYGENIFYAMNPAGVSAEDAVVSWYNEIKNYNFRRPGFNPGTGHFTQVVWKDSTELGIGMCESKPGTFYVVANYNPPGNVGNQYEANVYPAK